MRSLLLWSQQAMKEIENEPRTRSASMIVQECQSIVFDNGYSSSNEEQNNYLIEQSSEQSSVQSIQSEENSFSIRYRQQKQRKKDLETGILKFNLHPKLGIAYLIDAGFIDDSTKSIIDFIRSKPGLNKTMIGEYLGELENKKIMYAYVETHNFVKMTFDSSLRKFLSGFRIPGEAQKIDRMMEKFAQHYCLQNPDVFHSADVAYVLAYSVILLNTDLHSSRIKEKMTKEAFTKSNRNIDPEHQVNTKILEDIYDRIAANEIKMNSSDQKHDIYVHPKRRHSLFQKESHVMVANVNDYMINVSVRRGDTLFYCATKEDIDAVRHMFDIC